MTVEKCSRDAAGDGWGDAPPAGNKPAFRPASPISPLPAVAGQLSSKFWALAGEDSDEDEPLRVGRGARNQ